MKRFITLLVFLVLFVAPSFVMAQEDINSQIQQLEAKISELQTQGNSLSREISIYNSNIELSALRINTLKANIEKLGKEIDELAGEVVKLEDVLTKRSELVLHRIPAWYIYRKTSSFASVFFGSDISEIIGKIEYLQQVQEADARALLEVKKTQDAYNERKNTREKKKQTQETLKKQQEEETKKMEREKKNKQILLAQTKNSEVEYQRLLADAKAKLAGFASFADSQGTELVSGQPGCDDSNCYYNQRDVRWGNGLINGQGSGCNGPCSIARVGCLVTSVAMVAGQLGRRDILPSDVAFSGTGNFQVGTALLSRGSIYVKGYTINRSQVATKLSPDLLQGSPLIVGVYSGPFGTHFVVVKSYENGKYMMYDPYQSGGKNLDFSESYSLGSVFQVDRVSIN